MYKRQSFVCEDVFELLPRLEKEGEKFDVVILDPPAFTKSRNSIKNAIKGYREINLRGMKLVKDGGYLCTCSCSHFMDYELFTKTKMCIRDRMHHQHIAADGFSFIFEKGLQNAPLIFCQLNPLSPVIQHTTSRIEHGTAVLEDCLLYTSH